MDEIKFPWPKVSRLSLADEERLARQIQAGEKFPDDPEKVAAAIAAANKLVLANLGLVRKAAKQYCRFFEETISLEDLIQEGFLGLIKAAKKFDSKKGRFSTYAMFWIKQAFKRAVDDNKSLIRIPVNKRESRNGNPWGVYSELTGILCRQPTDEEWARALGLTLFELFQKLDEASPPLFLEEVLSDYEEGERRYWTDAFTDSSAVRPDQEAERSDLRRLLDHHFVALTDREKIVLIRRYGFDDGIEWSLAEIGHLLGISREMVRQIESRALEKLRQRLEGEIDI